MAFLWFHFYSQSKIFYAENPCLPIKRCKKSSLEVLNQCSEGCVISCSLCDTSKGYKKLNGTITTEKSERDL